MSLFSFKIQAQHSDKSSIHSGIEASRLLDSNALTFLDKSQFKSGVFISDANFSSYQLLNTLLDQFGPSDVWITSYGISETALRAISARKQTGLIKDLHFVFSDHVKRIKPREMQIAESIATKFCYYPCHAKIIVVRNQNKSATIISSMNMNRNNKLEAGFIGFDHTLADDIITQLTKIWNSAKNN
jgi:hypothetical protein